MNRTGEQRIGDAIGRAHVVGSMLRPRRLKEARTAYEAGALSPAGFKRIEDDAVAAAVDVQQRSGIDVITDGELRRRQFTGSLSEAVEGMGDRPADQTLWYTGTGELESAPQERYAHSRTVVGKLQRRRSVATEEFVYARATADRPVKVTLPSPLMMHTFWSREHSRGAYDDPFAMFHDAASILRQEVRELIELGCEFIQFDAPELAGLVDPVRCEVFRSRGIEPERLLSEGLDLLNSVAEEPGPWYGVHLCRGNREGKWVAEGGYESIANDVFKRTTNFHAFFLEYDDERSGTFGPLAELPPDKLIVLGLVSTKKPTLETVPSLLARLDEAARYVPMENLAVSPQCGFASSLGGNPVTADDQARKLELVGAVARRAWRSSPADV